MGTISWSRFVIGSCICQISIVFCYVFKSTKSSDRISADIKNHYRTSVSVGKSHIGVPLVKTYSYTVGVAYTDYTRLYWLWLSPAHTL